MVIRKSAKKCSKSKAAQTKLRMKLVALFVACLVVSVTCAPAQLSLQDDLDDFVALLPLEDLKNLAFRYILDKEVLAALAYLQGEEFSNVWDQFFAVPEVRDLLNYLEEAGIPAYDALNAVAEFLGLNPLKFKGKLATTGGLKGLLDELLELLPHAELEALFEEKLVSSSEFKALFERLQNFDYKQVEDLYENSAEVQSLIQKLRDHDIDVDLIVELVKSFFGWK
ncbi:protein G12-like isoform X2 [Anopheles albimanus]|uniref:protein G12-like isoform X2 n=1 Tax=Anopheles albimanus TaxID=7167 RepID=UPI00163F01FD|nr:protein G12-like isoform X2 [Anopheles albimanus]